MSTAACLVSEVNVLPLDSAVHFQPEKPAGDSPPLLYVSLKVPSDRDLQIYETAVFAGRSQRAVAKQFGVSQPRVNQILKEIAAWMADNTPSFCSGLTPEQKLRLVHYNVVQQLEYQRCSLMEAWEESRRGTETISRTTIVGGVSRTTATNRPSRANSRYVDAAARTSLAIAKLSGWTPAAKVTDAPQNSSWWQSGEKEGEIRQEEESIRQSAGGSRREKIQVDSRLSDWEEQARNPNLTRAEADAITAERQGLKAALQVQVEQLKSEVRERENRLSLGSGPLLPEGKSVSRKASKQDHKRGQRREFLREEPPRMTIREYIGPVQQPDK